MVNAEQVQALRLQINLLTQSGQLIYQQHEQHADEVVLPLELFRGAVSAIEELLDELDSRAD